jgi:cytochrome c oxidase cbb3-type subunit 3
VIERGRLVYGIHCRACHGVDLRGGDIGGPNLLRSEVMLNDRMGEALLPVVKGSLPGMNAIALPPDEVTAVAEYIHSVLATARPQGAPPAGPLPELNVLVGNAAEGKVYFDATCSGCHSATGDLQGIGARIASPMQLQNLWVAGGRGGRGGGGRGGRDDGGPAAEAIPPSTRDAKVVVSPPNAPKVEGWLDFIDDFSVTVLMADGTRRSFRRVGDVPLVEIMDPLATHKALLQKYTDRDIHNVTAYLVTLK